MNHSFSVNGNVNPNELFQAITHAFSGVITVIDKNGTVVYSQNLSGREGYSSQEWVGQPLKKWIDTGYISATPSLRVLESKKPEMDFLSKDGIYAVMTFANPLLDENGEIKYVVAFSLPEQLIHEFSKYISAERNRTTQLVNYLTNYPGQENAFFSQNSSIKETLSVLERVADSDVNIMITGETGVGKEVFSRYVHNKSRRYKQAFVPVNCSAIPPELMESEFFGYEKGAFTGASKEGKIGLFEMANNGTLFLDEIGELPLSMQPKLLRVLENREYRRIGGTKTCKVNVRAICSTNRDLYQMVKENTFREDLYYRLNVIPVRIPPLRERQEDIVPMAKFFLDKLNRKYSSSKIFSEDTLEEFKKYSWPGNVRELSNTVEKLYFTAMSNLLVILPGMGFSQRPSDAVTTAPAATSMDLSLPLKETMRRYEEQYIQAVLDSCGGKVALAAERLQITKAGLYKKLDGFKKAAEETGN